VANYVSSTVSAYAINVSTGALTGLGATIVGYNPAGVAIDPNGSFAYMGFDLEVAGYTINPSGTLTPVPGSPFAGGYESNAVAIDPLGKFTYVAGGDPEMVFGYSINPSNGALTRVQGSPFAAGDGPAGIATCQIEHGRCVPAPL
jgi:6-phosphogluconolactonase